MILKCFGLMTANVLQLAAGAGKEAVPIAIGIDSEPTLAKAIFKL